MKIVLPIGVIIAIGVSFAWPYLLSPHKEKSIPINVSHPNIKENRMLNPQYVSSDTEGKPYTVKAEWAKQRTKTQADLSHPQGTIIMAGGESVQVKAQKGSYDQEKQKLNLENAVTLTSSDGYRVTTKKATVSLDNHSVESTTYVEGEGPMGSLQGQDGFKIDTLPEGKKIITLKGPSRVTIAQKAFRKKTKSHD